MDGWIDMSDNLGSQTPTNYSGGGVVFGTRPELLPGVALVLHMNNSNISRVPTPSTLFGLDLVPFHLALDFVCIGLGVDRISLVVSLDVVSWSPHLFDSWSWILV